MRTLLVASIGFICIGIGYMCAPREAPIERIVEVRAIPIAATPNPQSPPTTAILYRGPIHTIATPEPVAATPAPATPKPFGSSLDKGAYAQKKSMNAKTLLKPNGAPAIQ